MREASLTTVFMADRCTEADDVIGRLRGAGLHPADLALTTPFPFDDHDHYLKYPIKVPLEEAPRARTVLENRP